MLRKLPAKESGSSSSSEKCHSEDELETNMSISREKCLPVVHGLISLLLSMDFTCNVDLFVIACKVGASSGDDWCGDKPYLFGLAKDQYVVVSVSC